MVLAAVCLFEIEVSGMSDTLIWLFLICPCRLRVYLLGLGSTDLISSLFCGPATSL